MKQKKILLTLTVCFFLLMLVFTFVSRYITQSKLPLAETMYPDWTLSVPEEAVLTDTKGNNYIFIVKEIDTILGTQPIAEKIEVKVINIQNNNAVLEGIDTNFEIIISSSHELAEKERIRREKETWQN